MYFTLQRHFPPTLVIFQARSYIGLSLRKFNKKTERYIERKIRTLGFSQEEFERLGPEILKWPHVRLWG